MFAFTPLSKDLPPSLCSNILRNVLSIWNVLLKKTYEVNELLHETPVIVFLDVIY